MKEQSGSNVPGCKASVIVCEHGSIDGAGKAPIGVAQVACVGERSCEQPKFVDICVKCDLSGDLCSCLSTDRIACRCADGSCSIMCRFERRCCKRYRVVPYSNGSLYCAQIANTSAADQVLQMIISSCARFDYPELKQYFDLRDANERGIYDFVCRMRLCELESSDEHLAKRAFFMQIGAMHKTDTHKDMLSFEDDYWKLLNRMSSRVWERRCPQGHEFPLKLDVRPLRVASESLVENCEEMTEILHMSAEKFAYLRDICPHSVDAQKCGETLSFTGQF